MNPHFSLRITTSITTNFKYTVKNIEAIHSTVSCFYCWWSLHFFVLCLVCSLAGSLYVVTRYMKYDGSGDTAGIAQRLAATHNLNRKLTQSVSNLISLLTFQWQSHSLLPRHIEARRCRGTPDAMTCQKERLRHKPNPRLEMHINLRRY